ncbi:MAG: hypothetical protein AAB481_04700 [Patescibacteria group bacterium]
MEKHIPLKRLIAIPDQGTPNKTAEATIAVLKAMEEADTGTHDEETFRIILPSFSKHGILLNHNDV